MTPAASFRLRAAPDPVQAALRPWARRLALEAVGHWLVRGASAGLLGACAVLGVGWLVPVPESALQPLAWRVVLAGLVAGLLVGIWPVSTLRRAAQLDSRLKLADRLTTAWLQRAAQQPMAAHQRHDALARLGERSLERDLPLRWRRIELGVLGALGLMTAMLLIVPSPQQAVLDQQAAEAAAIQQASQRLDALAQDVGTDANLSPEQAKRLQEILQQARADLARTTSQQGAQTVLANTAQQVGQLGDPNADAQEQAIGAMSETLSQEPLTRSLGDALARNDPSATNQALQDLQAQADQLSQIQRQALARALQRAANVGRGEPRTAAALHDAAQAASSGQPTDASLQETSQALQAALQAVTAQANLRSTSQRVQDLRTALASGEPLNGSDTLTTGQPSSDKPLVQPEPGRSLPIDAAPSQRTTRSADQQLGAGEGAATTSDQTDQTNPNPQASENVFVPGTANNGPNNQDLVQQPFTVRGQPRPYRDVLSQYAQAGRDYVDRPDVSPAVRDLVKQYFSKLEEGQ
jgi:hypothetical protein